MESTFSKPIDDFLVNDLTTGGTTKALTAEMGKTLNSNIALKLDASKIKEVSLDTNDKTVGWTYTVDLPSGCTYSNTRVLYTNYYYPGNATFADAQLANDGNLSVLVSLTTANKVSITLSGSLTNHGTIYVGLLKVS